MDLKRREELKDALIDKFKATKEHHRILRTRPAAQNCNHARLASGETPS